MDNIIRVEDVVPAHMSEADWLQVTNTDSSALPPEWVNEVLARAQAEILETVYVRYDPGGIEALTRDQIPQDIKTAIIYIFCWMLYSRKRAVPPNANDAMHYIRGGGAYPKGWKERILCGDLMLPMIENRPRSAKDIVGRNSAIDQEIEAQTTNCSLIQLKQRYGGFSG